MFRNEAELVDKLIDDLSVRFNTSYIVRELRSGNNIADVVYSTDIIRNNVIFNDYTNAYYYFSKVYSRKTINAERLHIPGERSSKKFVRFLHDLEDLGYLKIDGTKIHCVKKVDAVTKNFVAVEAKLFDWTAGLEQATRYKQYANEVYVALSSEAIKTVSRGVFRESGVGLMSVSPEKFSVPIRARKNKTDHLDVQYFVADRFLQELLDSNLVPVS
jgi:hypothetical protein